MRVLSPAQGYALWAPGYAETAVTVLESAAVESLGVPLAGRRVLDAGCGNGRRLVTARQAGASVVVGVDLTPEMLAQARASRHSERRAEGPKSRNLHLRADVQIPRLASLARNDGAEASLARNDGAEASLARNDSLLLAAADVRSLPVADGAFDVVWCRLVLGHVAELDAAYAELARVCAPGGVLVVTDFHPAATEAGHRRTFRDTRGEVHELEHHLHRIDAQCLAAARAGLALRERRDCAVDETVRDFYARAGRADMYERQLGLPLVLVLLFERVE